MLVRVWKYCRSNLIFIQYEHQSVQQIATRDIRYHIQDYNTRSGNLDMWFGSWSREYNSWVTLCSSSNLVKLMLCNDDKLFKKLYNLYAAFITSVPVSLQWVQAVAGQKSVHIGLELERAHEHHRPLGEAWELGLDQRTASDWDQHGENHSGKPEWGKEWCLAACIYYYNIRVEKTEIISLKHDKHIKFILKGNHNKKVSVLQAG